VDAVQPDTCEKPFCSALAGGAVAGSVVSAAFGIPVPPLPLLHLRLDGYLDGVKPFGIVIAYRRRMTTNIDLSIVCRPKNGSFPEQKRAM
jgi:hypothetical protein